MKHIGHIFVAVVALAAVCSAGAMTTSPSRTVEIEGLGMCVSSNALYFSFHDQIVKTDWYGRFLKRVVTFAELKDGKFTDISRYGVFDKQIER